ncbi:MAG: hypothetical protein EOP06_00450 [Proteobacteria bacterium]|nr:MAG: hypothetical protein EOP06_00450 [Pseudomonadota bacterium]
MMSPNDYKPEYQGIKAALVFLIGAAGAVATLEGVSHNVKIGATAIGAGASLLLTYLLKPPTSRGDDQKPNRKPRLETKKGGDA